MGCPACRRGLAHGVMVFANPDNLVTKRNILHTNTRAKTHATALLWQQTHTAERCAQPGMTPIITTMIKNEHYSITKK